MRNSETFRDPAGSVLLLDDRIIRIVGEPGAENYTAFMSSTAVQRGIVEGSIVETTLLDDVAARAIRQRVSLQMPASFILEHKRIFPSFPYEWPAEMLHEAAKLTISLAEALLREELGLKDATPFNILFHGPRPVFVDVLSIERRDVHDPIWTPYAQFVRTFLLPLLVNRYHGLATDKIFLSARDGLEPESVKRIAGLARRFTPLYMNLITLPLWLARRRGGDHSIYQKKKMRDPKMARYVLESQFKSLKRTLRKVGPKRGLKSTWSDYMEPFAYHMPEYFARKKAFVESAINKCRPTKVLDIGCNSGDFSEIAARSGAPVVAIDSDPVVIGEVWRRANTKGLNVLPLVVNLAQPSPSVGWRNREYPSFLDRVRGQFDMVMMLAIIHHLLVSDGIPLEDIVDLIAEITTKYLIIEYIDPSDPMFRGITRGRDILHADLNKQMFEQACQRKFNILTCEHIGQSQRWIYLMETRRF